MDRNQVRDLLLSGFKPKQLDLPTPYLVTADGTSLDGEIRLVGISGKEGIELRRLATVQTIDAQGNVTSAVDDVKLTGLTLVKCLYHRGSGEPLLDQLIPMQGPQAGNAADLQAVLGIEQDVFNKLVNDLNTFLGFGASAVADAKNDSAPTQKDSSSSNSQESLDGSAQ